MGFERRSDATSADAAASRGRDFARVANESKSCDRIPPQKVPKNRLILIQKLLNYRVGETKARLRANSRDSPALITTRVLRPLVLLSFLRGLDLDEVGSS